ncbi:MAG: transporter substrate-binding domain-containing protein, partial [Myxococcota bacterium]
MRGLALLGVALLTLACKESAPETEKPQGEAPAELEAPPIPLDPVAEAWEQALNSHRGESYTGNLDAIKKRGVLRVGMLNNAASYFIYRGQQAGFQLEMAELLAARMAVRLQVVVPPKPSDMERLLQDGKVDVIPLGQSQQSEHSFLRSPPFVFANHVIVQRASEAPIRNEAQLAGLSVHVRPSSRYRPFLEDIQRRVPTLHLIDADESLETEALIDRVASGNI